MDQQADSSEATVKGLFDFGPSAGAKIVEHSYTREELLSFAHLKRCEIRPDNLDPVVWRDTPTEDGADSGIGMMGISSRGMVRRDRGGEAFTKFPTVDVPEWRKDLWRSGGSASMSQGPSRKPYDEEPGNAFSTSYPPRPPGNWGDSSHGRNSYERSWLEGQGSGRWDHRIGLPDREREQGRSLQKWGGEDIVPVLPPDCLPVDGMRSFGTAAHVVPGWLPAERDGLLGSGGGLHRTFTGNFTHGPVRTGLDRQMSMGPPERQMSFRGQPERLMNMELSDRQMSIEALERQMSIGPGTERQLGTGPPSERHISMGPPPDRQMSLGLPPERPLSKGPPERQMSMGRQNSMGRVHPRHSESFHSSHPLKDSAFARREDNDLNNDETFGSEESSTDDRSEQERRRKESFESMRRDQQRQLQKQQKILSQKQEERLSNPEANIHRKHDESGLWDSTCSMEAIPSLAAKPPEKVSDTSEEAIRAVISTPTVVPSTSRPSIPPGFAKVSQQQRSTNKSQVEGKWVKVKDNLRQTGLQNEFAGLKPKDGRNTGSIFAADHYSNQSDVGESLAYTSLSESVDVVGPPPTEIQEKESRVSLINRTATNAGETIEGWSLGSEGIAVEKQGDFPNNPEKDISAADNAYPNTRESLLDRWFSTTANEAVDGGATLSDSLGEESQSKIKNEDGWSGLHSRMSKFAQWFHPEENQSTEGASISPGHSPPFPKGGARELSSNVLKMQSPAVPDVSRKGPAGSNVSKNCARVPMPSGPSLEDIEKSLTADANSSQDHQTVTKEIRIGSSTPCLKKLDVGSKPDLMSGVFGEHSPVGKFQFQQFVPPPPPLQPPSKQEGAARSSPVFLTCEDLEQSMLAEAGTTSKDYPHCFRPIETAGAISSKKDGQPVESSPSHHLLSLLHKSIGGGLLSADNTWLGNSTGYPGLPAKAPTDDHFNSKDGAERPSVEAHGLAEPSQDPSTENSTLEAMFGKAFMKELRSKEAPLSATGLSTNEGVYPVSRQNRGNVVGSSAGSAGVAKQWPAPIGQVTGTGRTEQNTLEARNFDQITNLPLLLSRGNQPLDPDKEKNRPVIPSGLDMWGIGGSSYLPDERQPMNAAVGNDDSFVSMSFAGSDPANSVVRGKGPGSGQEISDVNRYTSFQVNRNGKGIPSGVTTSGQLRVSDDSSLAPSQGFSSDDISKPSPAFTRDGSVKRAAGQGVTLNCGSSEDGAVAAGLGSDRLASRELDWTEMQDDDVSIGEKVDQGDDRHSGNEREMVDTVSENSGFLGRDKDEIVRSATMPTAGFLEEAGAGAGLVRANSNFLRFKGNHGAIENLPGFSPFQPVGPPLQHQHSVGAGFKSEATAPSSLSTRQQSLPVVHQDLQQNPMPASIAMFPPQQFRHQAGPPQLQQLLGRTFSSGNPLEFPHVQFGHPSSRNLSRPLSAGAQQFPPQGHGHLSQPAAYPPMRPIGPAPDHYPLPSPAQILQQGLVMPSMGEPHMFGPEQPLHDPHGLSKQGSQPSQPPFFSPGGHPLAPAGQGPMFHQPFPQVLHGPGPAPAPAPAPAPWVVPYSSELMRTANNGIELPGLVNGIGVAPNSLDKWFPTEPSRRVSGIPYSGLIPLSAHGLDVENKMRFG